MIKRKFKCLIVLFTLLLFLSLPFASAFNFGNTFDGVISGGNDRFTFTGQELDLSGLMYYGARYYDTNLRQFVQPDSLLPDMYDPQQLNRYSYVRNNPYKYVDPTGGEPIKSELVGVNQIISEIEQIEQGTGGLLNANQVLSVYAESFEGGKSKSFIYTSKGGFIDNQHFFTNVRISSEYGEGIGTVVAIFGGYAVEAAQRTGIRKFGGKESSFSYEDLPSNYRAPKLGGNINPNRLFSEQYADYIYGLGGSDNPAEDIPPSIYSTLPDTRADATTGRVLSRYKRSFDYKSKAIPQNKPSFFSRLKGFFGGGTND